MLHLFLCIFNLIRHFCCPSSYFGRFGRDTAPSASGKRLPAKTTRKRIKRKWPPGWRFDGRFSTFLSFFFLFYFLAVSEVRYKRFLYRRWRPKWPIRTIKKSQRGGRPFSSTFLTKFDSFQSISFNFHSCARLGSKFRHFPSIFPIFSHFKPSTSLDLVPFSSFNNWKHLKFHSFLAISSFIQLINLNQVQHESQH